MLNALTITPAITAQKAIVPTAISIALVPMICRIEVMETLWIVGPAIKNNNAAPGENPLSIKANATGTEALEQT